MRTLLCSLALIAGTTSCDLINTADSESVPGRGAKAFDPYAGPASGAIRLDLQMVNGCTILPTGQPVGKGSSNIPYPDNCQWPDGVQPPTTPQPPLEVVTGTKYFLDQITLMEYVLNQHTDPTNLSGFTQWMTQQTRFKDLDWSGLGIARDEWEPFDDTFAPGYFRHRISFGNAAWMNVTDDTFTLDVLDSDGNVRQTITYSRKDLLASNASNGHTLFAWSVDNVGAPRFPGDTAINPAPPPGPGYPPPSPVTFRSVARFGLRGSTNPNKTFQIPFGLTGDGAIRMTWSQIPTKPYYFPIRFVDPASLPANCYSGQDPTKRVPCTFGVQPVATMSPPKNGQFYQPGESFQITLGIKDGAGNYIHPPDRFPSWNESETNQANGLTYLNFYHLLTLLERDTASGFTVVGPRHLMRPYYDLFGEPYYLTNSDAFVPGGPSGQIGMNQIVNGAMAQGALPGAKDAHPSTTFNVTLPANAKPGTYNLNWKVHRFFMGERMSKLEVFAFQVGQAEKTDYPNRVGNCQICHRGVLSLDNLHHGGSVDHVENCKACHSRDVFVEGRSNTLNFFHKIHMNSPKYPMPKNNCTVCHLTRESTIRPSLIVCGGACHPAPHDPQYFQMEMTPDDLPNTDTTVYGNCAQQCHGTTPPTKHILPQE